MHRGRRNQIGLNRRLYTVPMVDRASMAFSIDNTAASLMDERQALAISISQSAAESFFKLRSGDPPTTYKVPQIIRQAKKVAYEPQIVSIGPYHNGKERLQGMEEHKWRYLYSFLSRNPYHPLEDYLEAIEEWEDSAQSCYSDNVSQMGKDFVKMMVLDGCFIVELFLKTKRGERDPMFGMDSISLIRNDMLLLENQIPFFLLQRIFEMTIPMDKPFPYSLAEIALDFLVGFMKWNKEIASMNSVHHLLHLYHLQQIPTPTPSRESNPFVESISNKWKKTLILLRLKGFIPNSNKAQLPITNHQSPPWTIPCATDLQLAGIKLKKKEKWNSILEVKFSNGVLEIPPLWISSSTENVFRNRVAFEQCYPKAIIRFTTYLQFMDCLVNTSKDVALLHGNGIIDHGSGSEKDVAHLINQLAIGTFVMENNYLSDLYKNVEKHCKTEWNMLWASLRRDYFTNPWSGLSSVAAAILILLTIIQTVFTVFAYYRPPS